MPQSCSRVLAGGVTGLDDGFAQEIATDEHEQRDQDAAPTPAFLGILAEQTGALQQPGQHKPEGSSFLVGSIANQGTRGATRTTQESEQARHFYQERGPFHAFELMQGAGGRAEDAQDQADQRRTGGGSRGEEDSPQQLAARLQRHTGRGQQYTGVATQEERAEDARHGQQLLRQTRQPACSPPGSQQSIPRGLNDCCQAAKD